MVFSALIAVIIVSLLSLLGASFLVLKRESLMRIISPLLAVSSGVLLGSAFFDLLPESLALLPDQTFPLVVVGIITFFSLEKLLQWHHHVEGDHPGPTKTVGYLSIVGDAIHNFVDGVIIGGAFLVSPHLGITVTIAVIAHEIPHELADFTILLHSGFTSRNALVFNFLSALTAVAGTLLVLIIAPSAHSFVKYLIPFGVGNFLYIAMSDLIPELHRPRSRLASLLQIILIIIGAAAISFFPAE